MSDLHLHEAVEVIRETLREPFEIRGDGGVSRKAIADALSALHVVEVSLNEAQRLLERSLAVFATLDLDEKGEKK